MTRIPTESAIIAAEARLVQSRGKLQQGVDRTRCALRAAGARPSTLVLVALASAIAGFLISHRRRPAVESVANSEIGASSRGLVRTLVSMFGARVLAFAFQQCAAAWKQRAAHVDAKLPSTSTERDH